MSPRLARFALALTAAAAIVTISGFGLAAAGWPLLVCVAPAVAAVLIAQTDLDAILAAASGAALGAALAPLAAPAVGSAPATSRLITVGVLIVMCALLTWGLRMLLDRTPRAARTLPWLGVAAAVMLLWATALPVATSPTPSGGAPLTTILKTDPAITAGSSDEMLYVAYAARVAAGQNYYTVARSVLAEAGNRVNENAALSYRMPTLYVIWAALPGAALVVLMLSLAAMAVVSAFALSSRLVRPPLALVSAVAVAAFFAQPASTVQIVTTEPWAAAHAVASAACAVIALGSERRRAWLVAAAALALGAALFRELLVFLPIAGLIASIALPELRARRDWVVWLAALALWALLFALHVRATGVPLFGGVSGGSWLNPGFDQWSASVTWGQGLLGGMPWMPWALAAAAITGAALAKDTAVRLFLLLITAAPVAGLFFLGPNGGALGGSLPGYWGGAVMPIAYACSAGVFALVRIARPSRP